MNEQLCGVCVKIEGEGYAITRKLWFRGGVEPLPGTIVS